MTPAIALAILSSYDKTLDLVALMLEKASDEDVAKIIAVWTENTVWWQEQVWRPLGSFISQSQRQDPPR